MSRLYATLKFNDGIEVGSNVFSQESMSLYDLAFEMEAFLADAEVEYNIQSSCFIFQGKEYEYMDQIVDMLEEIDSNEDEINLIVTNIEAV